MSHYDEHVGETAYFWGRVVRSEGETLVVRASSRTLSVGMDRAPPPGSAVQVYGRLEPGRTVAPGRVIVSRPSNLAYLYAVSLLGGLLAAIGPTGGPRSPRSSAGPPRTCSWTR